MTPHGHFHWNELQTRNTAKAREFYGDTLGWTFDVMPMGGMDYTVCMAGETPVAGMFDIGGAEFDGIPDHWFAFISVDDIDARVEKAKAAGAAIMRAPWDVPQVGRIAIVRDPTGVVIGWMTPSQ